MARYLELINGIPTSKAAAAVGALANADRVVATDQFGFVDPSLQRAPGARVLSSTNQSIATNTNTLITYSAQVYAYDWQMWDSAVPNRLTIRVPGVYLVGCSVAWAANATGLREVFLRANGTNVLAFDSRLSVGAARATRAVLVAEEAFQGNDFIQAIGWQNSGGNLDILTQAISSALLWARFQSPIE